MEQICAHPFLLPETPFSRPCTISLRARASCTSPFALHKARSRAACAFATVCASCAPHSGAVSFRFSSAPKKRVEAAATAGRARRHRERKEESEKRERDAVGRRRDEGRASAEEQTPPGEGLDERGKKAGEEEERGGKRRQTKTERRQGNSPMPCCLPTPKLGHDDEAGTGRGTGGGREGERVEGEMRSNGMGHGMRVTTEPMSRNGCGGTDTSKGMHQNSSIGTDPSERMHRTECIGIDSSPATPPPLTPPSLRLSLPSFSHLSSSSVRRMLVAFRVVAPTSSWVIRALFFSALFLGL